MNIGNFGHELADYRAEQEREAGIADVRRQLNELGSAFCVTCGDEIEHERRIAMPSATRCISCQERLERNRKQRSNR